VYGRVFHHMSVWLTIPSARPAAEIAARLERWRQMGYRIALWRNGPHRNEVLGIEANEDGTLILYSEEYRGWGASINELVRLVAERDPSAAWFVGGGDDTDPDPTKTADEIARECSNHFIVNTIDRYLGCNTWGIMQPTGDRFGSDEPWARMTHPNEPAYIDRICGSPWIGREAARRLNGGKGPLWSECYHMFSDQILKEHAERLGILWQRRDLTHYHDHPRRDGVARTPDFAALTGIYDSPEWNKSKAIYEKLKANDFRDCNPIT